MSAVVAVLNESLTESIKGFYKLRKAYITLDGILAAEAQYMKKRSGLDNDTPSGQSVASIHSNRSAQSLRNVPGGFGGDETQSLPNSRPPSIRSAQVGNLDKPVASSDATRHQENGAEVEEEDEFYDADEVFETPDKPTADSRIQTAQTTSQHGIIDHNPESDVFANPIDVFIHSGANLCFGLLLVMISLIPPAFNKLLFIIGFHGDKDRGIRMLWQASKFHNINGAMAGLIVLGYYNTFVGFSDIIPDSDPANGDPNAIEGYPRERCAALLADMRERHPKSHLWLLEESRMQASNKRLANAVKLLEGSTKSPLKQVEAIEMFEKSLDTMYMHDYALCSKSFVACVSLNNWSHALYYYIAGACNIDLYRKYRASNPKNAESFAQKANEFLKMAPKHAGKKKFMARQLPFDIFVARKLQKWESRALEWKVPLVDAVGVSPVEEMIFLWNGYKRMDTSQLETSLERLAWSEDSNPNWSREGADERAILALLRGATLRNLGRLEDAKSSHQAGVLNVDRAELKGGYKDDWTAPASHYEMGVICWMQKGEAAKVGDLKEEERCVKECERWVDKAAKWEAYELDARIGLKIATAQDTLRRWHEKKATGER